MNEERNGQNKIGGVAESEQQSAETREFSFKVLHVVLFASAVILIPICIYAVNFRNHSIGSNPAEWSYFGAFFNGTIAPLLSVINLGLVAHIAFNIQKATKSREEEVQRIKLLFELDREWNSALYESRTGADDLIKKNPHHSLEKLSRDFPTESKPVWIVLGFFRTLEFSIDKGIVDEHDAIMLFGQIFVWWDTVCVKAGFPEAWDTYTRIPKLRSRIEKNAPNQSYEAWKRHATSDLTERQNTVTKPPDIKTPHA